MDAARATRFPLGMTASRGKRSPKASPTWLAHSSRTENQPDGHLYRVTFVTEPDGAGRAAIAGAFEEAVRGARHVTSAGAWRWLGRSVVVGFDEGPMLEDFDATQLRGTFADIERILIAVAHVAPIQMARPARVVRGSLRADFEEARARAQRSLPREAGSSELFSLGAVAEPILSRPRAPAHLRARFAMIVDEKGSGDGAWWLIVPANDEPGSPVVVRVFEPDGAERCSAPLPWGKFPTLAIAPTSDFAIVTSTRIEEPFTGRFVPCIHRVERRDMTTRWFAEVEDVGDNQLCAVAFGPRARLLILTERGVALTEEDGRRIAFDACVGGRAIAATADGRYALVAVTRWLQRCE